MSDDPNQHKPHGNAVELPAGTVWPMITAFGFTLLFAGLVTHWLVSVTGFVILLRGFVGWWLEVLPHERHEAVPVLPEERPAPIPSEAGLVEHLTLGEGGHRVRIPAEIHPYSSGIKGGIVGGVVMAVMALAYGLLAQGSLWFPVNLLSAAVMPGFENASLETLKEFNLLALILGIFMHGTLSIIIGLLYAVALPMFPKHAWLWAGILAPLSWTLLFYATSEFLNPALKQHVNWYAFVACQLGFGMVGGFVVAQSVSIETMQTWPLAARIGVEARIAGQDPEDEEEKK